MCPELSELYMLLFGLFVDFEGLYRFVLVVVFERGYGICLFLINDRSDFAHAIVDGEVLHLK